MRHLAVDRRGGVRLGVPGDPFDGRDDRRVGRQGRVAAAAATVAGAAAHDDERDERNGEKSPEFHAAEYISRGFGKATGHLSRCSCVDGRTDPRNPDLDKYAQTTMTAIDSAGSGFGANSWLVEEMYEQFRSDPGSVSETWREFFSDYKPAIAPAPTAPPPSPRRRQPSPTARSGPASSPQRAGRSGGSRRADPRRRCGDRRQHGAQPVGADRDQLPQHPGQVARGQPQGHQRLPQP